MLVGVGHIDAQAHDLQPQLRVVHFAEQLGQGGGVHLAGVGPVLLGAGQQVFAQGVQHLVQPVGRQAERAVRLMAVEHVEFRAAEVSVGKQRQGDDAGGGFGAVAGIGAHAGNPFGMVEFRR